MQWRTNELNNEGLNLDGSLLVEADGDDDKLPGSMPSASTTTPVKVGAGGGEGGSGGGDGGDGGGGGGGGGDGGGNEEDEGLINVRIRHLLGVPTDDGALKRLPLSRAAAAIVSADVDSEDVDTQITDSEVITSAHLLMEIYTAQARREYKRTRVRKAGLTLICEFNDVLTKRLLDAQPSLIEPLDEGDEDLDDEANSEAEAEASTGSVSGGDASSSWVEVVPFHRQCLETSALSVSAHSHASWTMMRRILDAHGGIDVRSYRVTSLLQAHELADAPGGLAGSAAEGGHSFYELAARISARRVGHGILIGWRIGEGEPCINPADKFGKVPLHAADRLIVLTPQAKRGGRTGR
jgi:hypothetical protein